MTDIRAVERFLFHEAALLDAGRYEDWLTLFANDCWYWAPIEPGQDDPRDTVSIIYDDRRLLETRVRRLLNPNIHAQTPPSRTSRLIGNITIDGAETAAGQIAVSSRLQMVEHRRDRQRLFAAAVGHGLEPRDGSFRIAWKRVDLVDCDGVHDGIVVPF